MHGPDRDQTETLEAIAELTIFVNRYSAINPNDPDREAHEQILADGRQHLREAHDRLSDADYRVAYFYLKTQKFPPAAIDRFKAILKNDPEYSRRDARILLPRAGISQDKPHGRGAPPSGSSHRRIRIERISRAGEETRRKP